MITRFCFLVVVCLNCSCFQMCLSDSDVGHLLFFDRFCSFVDRT